mgnify:CR=1 FL=1
MIAIPAVDLRGGFCVQLVGGNFADERVRLDDPRVQYVTGPSALRATFATPHGERHLE